MIQAGDVVKLKTGRAVYEVLATIDFHGRKYLMAYDPVQNMKFEVEFKAVEFVWHKEKEEAQR